MYKNLLTIIIMDLAAALTVRWLIVNFKFFNKIQLGSTLAWGGSFAEKVLIPWDRTIFFASIIVCFIHLFLPHNQWNQTYTFTFFVSIQFIIVAFALFVFKGNLSAFEDANLIYKISNELDQKRSEPLKVLTDKELRTVNTRFKRFCEISVQQYVKGWRSRLMLHLELANSNALHFFIETEIDKTQEIIESIKQSIQKAIVRIQNQYIIYFVITVMAFILFATFAVNAGLSSGVLVFEDLHTDDPFSKKLYSITLFILGNEQISPQNNAAYISMFSIIIAVFILVFVLFNMVYTAGSKQTETLLEPFFLLHQRKIDQLKTILLISKYKQYDASEQKIILKKIFEGVKDSDLRVENLSEMRKSLD
ncbi:MAG: hypothetical protein ACO1OO_04490 [Flavisolibacter sp.]